MTTPAQFAAKCQRITTTIPRAQRQANEQAARALKPAWFAEAGLSPGSRIAGRKVSIIDSTVGIERVTTMLRWQGPVHLVEGDTAPHVIAARRLATRAGARRRLLGSRAEFGGSVRGAFGAGRSVKRGKRALTIGPNVRAFAFHPGTRGRRFWARNKASAHRITTTVYKQAALPAVLREAGFG